LPKAPPGICPSLWDATIRNGLTQRTGMQEPKHTTSPAWDELGSDYAQRIDKWLILPRVGTPGTGPASYYNHYFNLLILILEASTSQGYDAWVNANVYGPLEIGPLLGHHKLVLRPLDRYTRSRHAETSLLRHMGPHARVHLL